MSVKKVGDDPRVVKRVTCRQCSSILEYLPADVQTRTVSSFGDSCTVSYVPCPECSNKVEVGRR